MLLDEIYGLGQFVFNLEQLTLSLVYILSGNIQTYTFSYLDISKRFLHFDSFLVTSDKQSNVFVQLVP